MNNNSGSKENAKLIHKNKRKINQARYAIWFVATLSIVGVLYLNYINEALESIQIVAIFGAIFAGLGFYSGHKPEPALVLAIIFAIFPIIISAVQDYDKIFERVWWQLLILALFIRGLIAAKQLPTINIDSEIIDDL